MLSFLCAQVSAAIMAQPQGQFGYQIVRIIKTTSLGVGSYGAVYRALCNELPCAVKILHPTLFETNDPGARKIFERFEQECQFLSGVRHPNIVQYLGLSRDPESGLPVLLMELMDSSLTRFLERSEEPLPFHVQVHVCHDIALAIAYLHSNGMIHRDLSSNNVLLIGPGNRAKVTDFGMSKLAYANPRMTPMTMCPGTLAYMPPEALDDSPVYTNKLDCFSFGVLEIQILTRQFPDPSQRFKTMEINDPRFPTGQIKVPVPEVERRQSQIGLVDPSHPLMPVALDCLRDRETERPSAQELCHCLAALKETPQYGESEYTSDRESVRIRAVAEARERQREMEQLQQQHTQQIENLRQQLLEKDRTIATRETQLRQLNQRLEANEQATADFQHEHMESQKTIQELEQHLVAKDQQIRELQQQICDQPTAKFQAGGQSAREGPLCLHWSKCGRAPCEMTRPSSVVDGNMAYFNSCWSSDVYSYNSEKQTWSALPQCPPRFSSLAIVNGLLTTIGGKLGRNITNQLFSLTGERKWVEHFPPMPTKRYGAAVVHMCSGKCLVAAGGVGEQTSYPRTVEVMDTETLQWSTASSLPFALRCASATICQDHIYLLGFDTINEPQSVLACSMADLLQSCRSQSLGTSLNLQAVWHRVANLPVRNSSCATLCGQLLAVGGSDSFINRSDGDTTAIHQYNPANNSWEVISHMPTARSETLAAVLPGNKLMVVGGYIDGGKQTDKVEIATLQE